MKVQDAGDHPNDTDQQPDQASGAYGYQEIPS
jgi:hypothetical protein